MAKEVAGLIKLQIKGGAANPSPPVGPALGSKGRRASTYEKVLEKWTLWIGWKSTPASNPSSRASP